MMELQVRFKNISDEEQREHFKETAVAKLEDLNKFFRGSLREGELTGDCMIEHTGKHPAFKVHVTILHRQGKIHKFEAVEVAEHAEEAINNARNNLRNQIANEKDSKNTLHKQDSMLNFV
ncbi:MAG: HPF/RaiA family ribosome-associated protein [Candidatus Gracilibacteria bacterium]